MKKLGDVLLDSLLDHTWIYTMVAGFAMVAGAAFSIAQADKHNSEWEDFRVQHGCMQMQQDVVVVEGVRIQRGLEHKEAMFVCREGMVILK